MKASQDCHWIECLSDSIHYSFASDVLFFALQYFTVTRDFFKQNERRIYDFNPHRKGNKLIGHDFSYNWWLLKEPFVLC